MKIPRLLFKMLFKDAFYEQEELSAAIEKRGQPCKLREWDGITEKILSSH
jgi:hypothetical protein